jgi:hypothetical protein
MRYLVLASLLCAMCAALSQISPSETKRIEQDNRKVAEVLKRLPKPTEFDIEYRPIRGLEGQSSWHIGASHWWVRLHMSHDQFDLDDLDKTKRYRIKGIVLEQNYGVVEVWLHTYSTLEQVTRNGSR